MILHEMVLHLLQNKIFSSFELNHYDNFQKKNNQRLMHMYLYKDYQITILILPLTNSIDLILHFLLIHLLFINFHLLK